jgi:hypothetical protein
MGSLDLFKSARKAYRSKAGFDDHTTERHSVPDPLSDQLKGAWFCLKQGLLKPQEQSPDVPKCFPLDGKGTPIGNVPQTFLDVSKKGCAKIAENFTTKLFESFPDLRYQLLLGD